MKDTLKGFAWMSVVFGLLFLFFSFLWFEDKEILKYSIVFLVASIPLFLISSSMEHKERIRNIENSLNEMCEIMKENKTEE